MILFPMCRSDDEVDDEHIQKLMIVTQMPPSSPRTKAASSDRTGNFTTRAKMTVEIAQAINDGLYFYEQVSTHIEVVLFVH